MTKHDQYQEACLALESGVAAVEKIIRQRDEALFANSVRGCRAEPHVSPVP